MGSSPIGGAIPKRLNISLQQSEYLDCFLKISIEKLGILEYTLIVSQEFYPSLDDGKSQRRKFFGDFLDEDLISVGGD